MSVRRNAESLEEVQAALSLAHFRMDTCVSQESTFAWYGMDSRQVEYKTLSFFRYILLRVTYASRQRLETTSADQSD